MEGVKAKAGLNPSQRAAVDSSAGEIIVAAAAGSGKTRVLVERLACEVERGTSPLRLAALTFTVKAAQGMAERAQSRLRAAGRNQERLLLESGNVATIDGYLKKLLRENAVDAGIDPDFSVLDEDFSRLLKEEALERVFERETFDALIRTRDFEALGSSLLSLYEKSRTRGVLPRAGAGDPAASEFVALLEAFDSEYRRMKRERAFLDFADLLEETLKIFDKPAVADRLRRGLDLVLVDEFQDVNRMQARFLEKLAGGKNLFLVGDVRQAIYGFRHADCGIFIEKKSRDGNGARLFELKENYRARPELVEFVNQVFCDERASGEHVFGAMESARERGGPYAEIKVFEPSKEGADEARRREARWIGLRIRELVREGARYGDIAVLYRAMTGIDRAEAEWRKLGIPYHLVKGKGFYARREIQDLLSILRALQDPADTLSALVVLKSPFVGLSDDALWIIKERSGDGPVFDWIFKNPESPGLDPRDREFLGRFRQWFPELRDRQKSLSLGRMIDRIFEVSGYDTLMLGFEGGVRRALNLAKFREMASEFERLADADLGRFVRLVDEMSWREIEEPEASVESEGQNAVRVLTIHAAKGLEFPVVFVAGLGDRRRARSESAVLTGEGELFLEGESRVRTLLLEDAREEEEGRRLLYVALTRAEERLVCVGTRVGGRRVGGRIADGGLRIVDGGLGIVDGGLGIMDGGLRIADGGLRIVDGGLRIVDGGLRIVDGGLEKKDEGIGIGEGGVEKGGGGRGTWLEMIERSVKGTSLAYVHQDEVASSQPKTTRHPESPPARHPESPPARHPEARSAEGSKSSDPSAPTGPQDDGVARPQDDGVARPQDDGVARPQDDGVNPDDFKFIKPPVLREYFETLDLSVSALVSSGERRAESGKRKAESGKQDEDRLIPTLRSPLSAIPDSGRDEAARTGMVFHAILQHVDYARAFPDEVARLLGLYAPQADSPVREELERGLRAFLESEPGSLLKKAALAKRPVHRELPFLYRMREGDKDLGFLSGQVDLLYSPRKGLWTLIDYKTGVLSGHSAAEHADQMRVYAFCLERLLGEDLSRAILFYSGQGIFEEVSLEAIREPGFEKGLAARFARLRAEKLDECHPRAGGDQAVGFPLSRE